MTDLITVPLAHKIPVSEAVRLGAAEHRDYKPGENITVPRASAEMLAAAAQLQVDPRDREAVARLLRDAPAIPAAVPSQTPAPVPAATPVPSAAAAPVASTGTLTATAAVTTPATPQVPRN